MPISNPELNTTGIASIAVGSLKMLFNKNSMKTLARIMGFSVKKTGIDDDKRTKKNIPRAEKRLLNSKSVANWLTISSEKMMIRKAEIKGK
jgi:hypothetical protein